MKTYILTAKVFILASFFFVSCAPYVDVVKVDILNPSTSTFTFTGKEVAIVGNLYELEDGKYLYDSTLVAQATEGIKHALERSPVFDNYDIPIYYTYTSDFSLVGKPMSKGDIDSLASSMGVEMFVVVDFISVVSDEPNDEKSVGFNMVYGGLFRVYSTESDKPYASYVFQSEQPEFMIMNDEYGAITKSTGQEAKASLAYRVGENYALYVAPYWEEVERVYYVAPDDELGNMRKGDRYAQRGEWTKAMECWNNTVASSAKNTQVAMAAFNIAVGCEMLGDLELAQSWLEYCKKLKDPKINPTPYMQTISSRIQDKKALDEKLGLAE